MTNFAELSDNDLMLLFKDGNEKAFEVLHMRRRGNIYRHLLFGMGLREAVAEELAQETWFAIIANRHSYETAAQFITWALTIARRKAMDYQFKKSTKSEIQLADDEDDDKPGHLEGVDPRTPEAVRSNKDLSAALENCRRGLTSGQREVLSLKEEGEMTLTDVALLVGVDRSSVAERAKRAYENMRKCLNKTLGEAVVAAFLKGETAQQQHDTGTRLEINHDHE